MHKHTIEENTTSTARLDSLRFSFLECYFLFCFPTSSEPALYHTQKENISLVGVKTLFRFFHSNNKSEQPLLVATSDVLTVRIYDRDLKQPELLWGELSHPVC